jgi:hypothetical protein
MRWDYVDSYIQEVTTLKKSWHWPEVVGHACNPSCLEGGYRKIVVWGQPGQKKVSKTLSQIISWAYNTTWMECGDRRITVQGQLKKIKRFYLKNNQSKRVVGIAQVVVHLPSTRPWVQNSSTVKKIMTLLDNLENFPIVLVLLGIAMGLGV